jgi:hypothetical protein
MYMTYLSKEDLLLKLSPYGVKSVSGLNRLIREQHLPTKYISPRKVFFDEAEIEIWLSRRFEGTARANSAQAKAQQKQRKLRKENALQASVDTDADAHTADIKTFKAKEA